MIENSLLIALCILTFLLFITLVIGVFLKKENIFAYKGLIITVLLHSLFLTGATLTNNSFLNVALNNTLPILNLLIFRFLYSEFSKIINRKETNAVMYVFVRSVPFIFMFVMSLSTIQLYTNKDIEVNLVEAFDFFVVYGVVAYQIIILIDLFIVNVRLKKAALPKYQQFFLINILSICVYCFILLTNVILGTLQQNIIISGMVYIVISGFMMINYIHTDYLYEAKVYKKKTTKLNESKEVNKTIALDTLTGYFTREYFIRHIKNFDKDDDTLSVVIMQLTGLKLINESFGYEHGDDVLQEITLLVSEVFSDSTIARMSGSQFAIIQTDLSENEINEKIILVENICKDREGFVVNMYFGIYMRRDSDLMLFDLYKRAEDDLYYNKLLVNQAEQNTIAYSLWRNFCKLHPSLSVHLKRCASLAEDFGKYLELCDNDIIDLKNAALLHDIALTTLPKLDDCLVVFDDTFDERMYKSHTFKGYEIAIESGININTAKTILYHHENYNGKGFPHGLSFQEVPLLAQIVSIIDLVDMQMHLSKKTEDLETILLSRMGIEFSEELVYNMIDFLKKKKLIKEIS